MSVPLVKDLERRLKKCRQQVQEHEGTIRELRLQLEAYKASYGSMHPEYTAIMADITHAAYNGVRRPADLGGPVTGHHAESNPPRYEPRAYELLQRVQNEQRGAATALRKRLSRIVDGEAPPKEETDEPTK
jgi:transcription antitermination factor NusG